MRLAFAISTSVSADILLMDEWLSVGDAGFKEKASQRMDDLLGEASILVIASHEPSLIKRVCNRCITLEHGRIISDEPVVDDDDENESGQHQQAASS